MRRAFLLISISLALGSACPACSDAADREETPTVKPNRLKDERSPYLRQHQHNPVDWYPWGPEALERAKTEDRPILLSVGYAACHWCHVMEHESFEDEATAKVLNEIFVCVKVDREERPDVDRIYMTAVQVFSGRGGWPMTVLLTPDGKPFWAGTYLPKDRLQGLAKEIGRLWTEERDKVNAQAEAVTERVQILSDGPDAPETDGSDADLLEHMRGALKAAYDPRHGGYGTRPKFPPHTELLFYVDPDGADEVEQEHAERTLVAMDEGGMHDHVGGGFHRYSTDAEWLLPHFEKMLYDNALLLSAYAGMYARTKRARYKRVADRIVGWLEREMKRPGGGYASSLDADTEGEEGLTYTWTPKELEAALGEDDAVFASGVFGFRTGGNFHDEATRQTTGRNVVFLPRPVADLARERGLEEPAMRARIDAVMERMLTSRATRAQPGLDDKVITAWNALLISGLARAAVDLETPRYLTLATELAAYLLKACRREDGTLLRFPKGSGPEIVGFCEDYAHMTAALLDLADATGDTMWAGEAETLAREMITLFYDATGGGFWATSETHHERLVARAKEIWDSPIPSENGVAAHACLRLHARTPDDALQKVADGTLRAFRPLLGQPRMASMLSQLFRALRLRMRQEGIGAVPADRGDVHVPADHGAVDVFLQRDAAAPGGSVPIVVRLTLDDGWHAFAPGAEDGLPVELRAIEGAPAALEGIALPAGDDAKVLRGAVDVRALLAVPADAPAGPRKITLVLRLQLCADDAGVCLAPEEIRLEIPLRFGDQDGPPRHPSLFK